MNVTVTVKKAYQLSFSVKQYIGTEGGMDVEEYGEQVETLEQAIVILEDAIAKENGKYNTWQIVVDVK